LHLVTLDHLTQGAATLASWFLLPIAITGFLMIWLSLHNRRIPSLTYHPTLKPYLYLFIVYPAFLMVSISFFDFLTPLDTRILSPMLVCGIVIFSVAIQKWFATSQLWKGIGRIAILLGLTIHLIRFILEMIYIVVVGSGTVNLASDTIQTINQLPQVELYSNEPAALFLETERHAYSLPVQLFRSSQQTNPNYDGEVQQVVEKLASGDAIIVYLATFNWAEAGVLPLDMLLDQCENPLKIKEGYIFTQDSCF
jgi:hypothetical protein